MTVTQFQMERGEAYDKAREYEAAIEAGKAFPGDEDLALAYRAMSEGKVIIDLHVALAAAGVDADGRPRLAITRADARKVHFFFTGWERGWSFSMNYSCDKPRSRRHVDVPFGVLREADQKARIEAVVPSIPPNCRPARTPLDRLYILWEAEWMPKIPKDPFLLKQVTRTMYVVLAHWDLTPLEQAVLRNRVMP